MRAGDKNKNCDSEGFTLIELLVSIAIIALITAVVVFNQGDFADQQALSNVAAEIDLVIREAQIYGVGVREYAPSTNEFTSAYGVSFNLGNSGSSNNSFPSFIDRNTKNGYYDTPTSCTVGGTSECLGKYNLIRNNIISKICVIQSTGVEICSSTIGRIDISFLRPDPFARFVFFNSSGGIVTYSGHRGARIELSSPKGKVRSIVVYTTGQIAVQ